MFHVSQLKKCRAEMADIPLKDIVSLEAIQLDSDLTYEERVGNFVIFLFEFFSNLEKGSFDFNYFIFKYLFYKNKRENIK